MLEESDVIWMHWLYWDTEAKESGKSRVFWSKNRPFPHLNPWVALGWVQPWVWALGDLWQTFENTSLLPSSCAAGAIVKISPQSSVLQPQCRNTLGSLSVADCYELFMVSLSAWIPRRRRQLWAERWCRYRRPKSERLNSIGGSASDTSYGSDVICLPREGTIC